MAEDRQIHAMIEFIERDAQEKAREYDDEAQSLYDAEKATLVEAAKKKVAAEAEEAKKQAEVTRRVARAMLSKEERMRVNDARSAVLDTVQSQTEAKVRAVVKDAGKYKQLLADLLRQSALAIDGDCEVTCRKQDEGTVKGLLKSAEEAVAAANGKKVSISLAKNKSLSDEEDWGGVVLTTTDGRISCHNTLKYRAQAVIKEQLPTLRHALFHPQGLKHI